MKIVQVNEKNRTHIFEAVSQIIEKFKGKGMILEECELALIDVMFSIRIEKLMQLKAITVNSNPDKEIENHRQEI